MTTVADPQSLAEMIHRRARTSPDAPAVLTLDGEALTFGEVAAHASALRAQLVEAGATAGVPIALYLTNVPAWVVASLAVWDLGAPIAVCGGLLSPAEVSRVLEVAGSALLVTTPDRAESLDGVRVVTVPPSGRVEGGPARTPPVETRPDAIACIFFTSGTTGLPKGVPHAHERLAEGARKVAGTYARGSGFRPDPAPPHLAPGIVFSPYGHAAGYGATAFRFWIGRPVVLVPKFSVEALAEVTKRYQLEAVQLTPAAVHMLASSPIDAGLAGLKYVTSGTAPLPQSVREAFQSRYDVPVLQAYGMTEIGTIAQERYDDVVAGRTGPGCVGRPPARVTLKIVDPDSGEELPPGADGEVLVRTDTGSEGYLGGAALPMLGDYYRTGDRGHLEEDGRLVLTGRLHEKLIVGGFNVYPIEVEEALRASGLVTDAVVVGMPDERLGDLPVAGVVWAGPADVEALTAEARDRLAHYKVPRRWFSIDAVPTTSRGKVDRRAALQLAEQALAATRH